MRIVNCRSSFLGLLLAMSVQIWAVLSVTAMRLLGRKTGGGRSVSPESRSGFLLLTSTSCSGFGMLCSDLGLSDSSLEACEAQPEMSESAEGAWPPFNDTARVLCCQCACARGFNRRPRLYRWAVAHFLLEANPSTGNRSTDCEPLCQKGPAFSNQVGRVFPSYTLRWSMWLWTLSSQMVGGMSRRPAGSQIAKVRCCWFRIPADGLASGVKASRSTLGVEAPSGTAVVKACTANACSTKLPTPRFGFPFSRGNAICS